MKTSPSAPNSKFSYPLALNIRNLPAIAQVIEYGGSHMDEIQISGLSGMGRKIKRTSLKRELL